MGYEFRVLEVNFHLPHKNFEATLKSIRDYDSVRNPVNQYPGSVESHLAKTIPEKLEAALLYWRWKIYINESGDIDDIDFEGINLHDADNLFEAIAPYVQSGSYISAIGEDNRIWK